MNAPCELIDAHAHLDMARFEGDLDAVVARAASAGIIRIICAGIDLPSSRKAIELARRYSPIYAAVGIHPEEASHATQQDIETLSVIAKSPKVVAIGEIGLDFYRDYGPREKQIDVFRWQLELASRLNMPVVIHARAADDELIPLLNSWQKEHWTERPGVIHCFNGALKHARLYLEMGFYLSLGCYIGYPSAKAVREVVAQLPLERLLLETDSPFLPPQSRRGERNEPAYVIEAAEAIAQLLGISLTEVVHLTTINAEQVFSGLGR